MDIDRPISIRDLYPHMSEAELAVAEETLKRYVAVLFRICERLQSEGKRWPGPPGAADLTALGKHHTIPGERSNCSNN